VDANGFSRRVVAGEAILVFPELPHAYGPIATERWDEMYLTFDGPVFDLWRQAGLLAAARPVVPMPPNWPARLRALIEDRSRLATAASRLRQISEFLTLLTELVAREGRWPEGDGETVGSAWAGARSALDTELGKDRDLGEIAEAAGMSYESFRKRFQRETGVSPARYRSLRRIEAAQELLRYSPQLTNRQVAETLGFADEYHFSRRFTQIVGVTPRDFRRRGREDEGGGAGAKDETDVTVRRLTPAEMPALWWLRAQVLRPGRPAETAVFDGDSDPETIHLGAFTDDGRCVAVTTLVRNKGLQLRGMAVALEMRGRGVGAALLHAAHDAAAEAGFDSLWCNARQSAAGFYERHGWVIESDEFDVPGIGPHYTMRYRLDHK